MIPKTALCIVMFAERQAQILLPNPNLSLEEKLKRESPVYHNKTKLSIFCLIQSINDYVQINTHWRYIHVVRIMVSNVLLLASKTFFPTSQGLVSAGMNCRALR